MISPEPAEVDRRLRQNKSDIEDNYELLKKVEVQTAATITRVDRLTLKVDNLTTDVHNIKADVGNLRTEVTTKFHQVYSRFDEVDSKFDQVNVRFDRLEALLTSRHDNPSSSDVLRTPLEKKVGVLEMKMDVYNGRTSDHIDELKRHNQMFDAYDERLEAQDRRFDAHEQRFDNLDAQMTEVLGILRGATK